MKKRSHRIALAVLAALAGLGLHAGRAAAAPHEGKAKTEAVAFQIDLAHSGSAQFTKFVTPLKLKWSVTLGGHVSYPLIAEGKVFVTVSDNNRSTALLAFNLKTGALMWQSPIGGTPNYWSNAAYENGAVFTVDYKGAVQSFNAKTGKINWGVPLQGQFAFTSPPVASGGLIFISGYGSNGTIYAVDEKTGRMAWTQPVNAGGYGAPTVAGNGLYLAYGCDVYDLDPASGEAIWHYTYGCAGGGGKTPVYSAGHLYARNQTEPDLIFDATDGAVLGNFAADPPPAFFTDAGGNSMEAALSGGTLYGLNAATGEVVWTFIGDKYLQSAPIVINGKVVEGSGFGHLYVLDGDTGTLDWSASAGSPFLAPNEFSAGGPLAGFGAAADTLVVPATNLLLAYTSQ